MMPKMAHRFLIIFHCCQVMAMAIWIPGKWGREPGGANWQIGKLRRITLARFGLRNIAHPMLTAANEMWTA